jgi:2-iminobutanoate/2-iminopropanoate deaminase
MTSPRTAVSTTSAPAPRGHYSQARIVGDLIFTAGVLAFDPETNQLVGVGDVAEQTRQVFRNLSAILAEAGATLDDIVKVTCFLQDLGRDRQAYDAVFPEFLTEPYPARLTAGATLGPDALVEIEVVAVRPA